MHATADDLDRYVTLTDAAQRLAIGRSTAFRMAKQGSFPVPVRVIAGKQVVSLRLLSEYMHDEKAA